MVAAANHSVDLADYTYRGEFFMRKIESRGGSKFYKAEGSLSGPYHRDGGSQTAHIRPDLALKIPVLEIKRLLELFKLDNARELVKKRYKVGFFDKNRRVKIISIAE